MKNHQIVYVITCDGKVSQEAYDQIEKAQFFCATRGDQPIKENDFFYSSCQHTYCIVPVTVK